MATPPRPLPGVTQVAFTGTFSNAKWANVMHVNVPQSGAQTQANAQQLALDMHNQYVAHFMPLLDLGLDLLETNVIMFAPNDQVFEGVSASPASGQDSGISEVASVALVVSWRISQYYRGGHPRTYLCGLVADRMANRTSWSAQTIADFNAGALNFLSGVNNISLQGGGTVTLGYLQRFEKGGSIATPKVFLDPPRFHPFVGAVIHPRVDTQRRRLGREATT